LLRSETIATALLCVLLAAVGGFAWWLQLRPELQVVEAGSLAAVPERIGPWRGHPIPLDQTVESVLRADANVQRAYAEPTGAVIWLYIGYYGTARGGRPEHTPRGCYTGAGWAIEASRVIPVAGVEGLRVEEYRVEQDGERRLVHFWFRSHRRTGMVGGFDQNWDRLVGRLFAGRADGALIRLSTPLSGDEVTARSRLLSFATALDPLVARHWPDERPAPAQAGLAGLR